MYGEMETKIIEGTKVLAEFMGWQRSIYDNLPNKMYKDNYTIGLPIDQFLYYTSWDWIMEVCKKWNELHTTITKLSDVEMYTKYVALSDDLNLYVIKYKIEPVFEQLVINIEWYNSLGLRDISQTIKEREEQLEAAKNELENAVLGTTTAAARIKLRAVINRLETIITKLNHIKDNM